MSQDNALNLTELDRKQFAMWVQRMNVDPSFGSPLGIYGGLTPPPSPKCADQEEIDVERQAKALALKLLHHGFIDLDFSGGLEKGNWKVTPLGMLIVEGHLPNAESVITAAAKPEA